MNWQDVQGYFTQEDARDYRFLVSQIPNGGRMVEIGSFRGRSLASIADLIISKNLEVHAVDIFDLVESPEYIEPDVYKKKVGMHADFLKTLETFNIADKVIVKVSKSTDAAIAYFYMQKTFNLIFIDADHSYEAVKDDIIYWWPLLSGHGIMCGHDYDEKGESWPGVYRAIHSLFGEPDHLKNVWAIKKMMSENTGLYHESNIFKHD